ncbi:hypothetical protein J4Q44_G00299800, partial [Coregonus suidteri]
CSETVWSLSETEQIGDGSFKSPSKLIRNHEFNMGIYNHSTALAIELPRNINQYLGSRFESCFNVYHQTIHYLQVFIFFGPEKKPMCRSLSLMERFNGAVI